MYILNFIGCKFWFSFRLLELTDMLRIGNLHGGSTTGWEEMFDESFRLAQSAESGLSLKKTTEIIPFLRVTTKLQAKYLQQ